MYTSNLFNLLLCVALIYAKILKSIAKILLLGKNSPIRALFFIQIINFRLVKIRAVIVTPFFTFKMLSL